VLFFCLHVTMSFTMSSASLWLSVRYIDVIFPARLSVARYVYSNEGLVIRQFTAQCFNACVYIVTRMTSRVMAARNSILEQTSPTRRSHHMRRITRERLLSKNKIYKENIVLHFFTERSVNVKSVHYAAITQRN